MSICGAYREIIRQLKEEKAELEAIINAQAAQIEELKKLLPFGEDEQGGDHGD